MKWNEWPTKNCFDNILQLWCLWPSQGEPMKQSIASRSYRMSSAIYFSTFNRSTMSCVNCVQGNFIGGNTTMLIQWTQSVRLRICCNQFLNRRIDRKRSNRVLLIFDLIFDPILLNEICWNSKNSKNSNFKILNHFFPK